MLERAWDGWFARKDPWRDRQLEKGLAYLQALRPSGPEMVTALCGSTRNMVFAEVLGRHFGSIMVPYTREY